MPRKLISPRDPEKTATDPAPYLHWLSDDRMEQDAKIIATHARLHAVRLALIRSVLTDRDAMEDREPLWMEFHALRRTVAESMARIEDAIDSMDLDTDDTYPKEILRFPVGRSHGFRTWQEIYPYLGGNPTAERMDGLPPRTPGEPPAEPLESLRD